MKRIRNVVIFFAIVSVMLCFAFLSSATGSKAILYKNDAKYTITDYPVENVDGKLYVPVSFFIGLKNIQYEYATAPAGFYLRNKETDRYLSFSSNSQSIVVDGELINVSFPIMNSTVYMPLEYCSQILSLTVEKKNDGTDEHVRLTDGTQRLTFDELIKLYAPVTPPDTPSVIEPDKPDEPVEPVTPSDRYLYITFDSCPNESTESLLDTLEKHDVKATFFFDREGILKYPEAVIRAFVMGHGIGVCAETPEEADSANDALYSVLNYRTRLLRIKGELTDGIKSKAQDMGYVAWGFDLDIDTWRDSSARDTARDMYNKTFEYKTTVIRLTSDEKSSGIIERLMYYMSADRYATEEVIYPTDRVD